MPETETPTWSIQNASQGGASPLLYSRLEPLSNAAHRGLKIRPLSDFTFAHMSNTVPLAAPEFTRAARNFPILLLGDDLVPAAALGVRPGQNVFVSKGVWEPFIYIPAYLRRHPFLLFGAGEDNRLTLGIDVAAATSKPGARPLFAPDGQETDLITQALDYCNQVYGAFLHTQNFSAALKSSGIVIETKLEIEPTPGRRLNLGTFKRIDEERLQALPDATIYEWRKRGFLHAAYFLLQSMNNWDVLLHKAGIGGRVISPG